MFENKIKSNPFLLSIVSGLLLYLSFTDYLFFVVFIAFVPLLLLANQYLNQQISSLKFIFLSLISFLIWNGLTTWWISLASAGGALMAIVANSILMCVFFVTTFSLQKKKGKNFSFWWLIPFWISFEYLHFHWDLMWPWLTLGNVFAFRPELIQWYEFTGTSGGTLWILAVNILLANLLIQKNNLKTIFKKISTLIFIPFLLSMSLYNFRSKQISNTSTNSLNVMIVQPNIDPYNEKFYVEPLTQVYDVFQQIHSFLNDSIDVILLPETFITENIYEGSSKEIFQYSTIKFLRDSILSKHPEITIITGANTFKFYSNTDKIPATARKNIEGMYYDIFNSAMCIYKDSIQIIHKSKLVPGVEKMPYPALFKPLESLAIDLGGTTGSLGKQDIPALLKVKNKIPVATVICYESVFSAFVSQFFKMGSNALFVITNDGWWGNTDGYYQHLLFGRLRAIENRTYIARSANTGVSAVINPLGKIYHSTNFWEKDVLIEKIPLLEIRTVYSYTGDVISGVSLIVLIVILLRRIIYTITK